MARISDLPDNQAAVISAMKANAFAEEPFVSGGPLAKRRVSIVTTAGLHRRDQPRFRMGDTSYRKLDGKVSGADLIMSQGSVGFDRTGFQQDVNTLFPIDRLREAEQRGMIGSIGSHHYSLSSAFSDALSFETVAGEIANELIRDNVDAVVLIPA